MATSDFSGKPRRSDGDTTPRRDIQPPDEAQDEVRLRKDFESILDEEKDVSQLRTRFDRIAESVDASLETSPFSEHEFIALLSTCTRIRCVIELLLKAARQFGFKNIRYHYYSHFDQRLVSVDCAGHSSFEASKIRRGGVVKFRWLADPTRHDSYLCFAEEGPTVFHVDNTVSILTKREDIDNVLPHFALQRDQCETVFESKGPRIWVDIPLQVRHRFIGKLSCDLALENVSKVDSQQVLEFEKIVRIAAPYLELLYDEQIEEDFEETRQLIGACTCEEEVFETLVDDVASTTFSCDYACVYLLKRDHDVGDVFVLTKTNYLPIKEFERKKAYRRKSVDCIVPWGAGKKRTLRFENVGDNNVLLEQCESYQANINWENDPLFQYTVGKAPIRSMLTVTILGVNGEILGVVQLSNKFSNDGELGYFSDRDQRLLERVCREIIGPKLQTFRDGCKSRNLEFNIQWGAEASALATSPPVDVLPRVVELLKKAIPESQNRKLYTVFLLHEETTACDQLDMQSVMIREYEIQGDLKSTFFQENLQHPSKSCRKEEDTVGVYYCMRNAMLNDRVVNLLKTTEVGYFEASSIDGWVTPDVVCAVGCRIGVGDRPLGAIVVKSESYDLSEENHGEYLKFLAASVEQSIRANQLATPCQSDEQ